jgi:hypothetical protein
MITERHVQAIWYDRALRPKRLYAVGGSAAPGDEVHVVYPGTWNLGSGPDFKDAVLEIGPERRRISGDVEVHLSPSDWDAHGHCDNPAYSNVVVHVTWRCGPPPSSLPPGAVTIWIGRYLVSDLSFAPESIDLGAYPFGRLPSATRACFEAMKGDPDLAHGMLVAAGRERLASKAARFRRLLGSGADPTQLFYSEVMGALGYSRNANAFRAIAAAVPYRQLVAEPENAAAAFSAASGFAEVVSGGRPCNRPERRLAAAAELFATTPIMELAGADDFSPSACKEIVGMMASKKLVGRGRSAAVVANIVVPWAMARGRIAFAPEWLPPEDVSEPVRLMAFRMLGRDHNPAAFYSRNGLCIQGLIGIYRKFCSPAHPDCDICNLFSAETTNI